MISFYGEHTVKIDDKGRMVFPSSFKSLFPEGEQIRLMAKKDLYKECLQLYTMEEWNNQCNKVAEKLNFFNDEQDYFWGEFLRDCAPVNPDGKLGRILIPKKILCDVGIDWENGVKEVVFAGKGFKIEIWEKSRYEQRMPKDKFTALAKKLLG